MVKLKGMKNNFILAVNDHSIINLWPGKIDGDSVIIFTNTSATVIQKTQNSNTLSSNNTTLTLLYICLCFALTFFIVKKFLIKKRA